MAVTDTTSTSTAGGSVSTSGQTVTATRSYAGQRLLLVPALGIIVGSFLVWVDTAFRSYGGFQGAGRFTFYLGILVTASAFLPLRRVAAAQAALAGGAALVLGLWQLLSLSLRIGFTGWMPGPGLILTIVSGLVCFYCVGRMVGLGDRARRA